jgi:Acyl-CoA dehydrogenase, N-terminal domain.
MEQNELLEPFARMLEAVATPALVRKVEEGEGADVMWNAVVESGFLDALVAEDAGGFGLSLADVGPLFQALGRFAVPLPVGETMIARALLAAGGAALPEGAIALSTGVADGEAVVSLASVSRHVLADRARLGFQARVGGPG